MLLKPQRREQRSAEGRNRKEEQAISRSRVGRVGYLCGPTLPQRREARRETGKLRTKKEEANELAAIERAKSAKEF